MLAPRYLSVLVLVVALLAALAPPAQAQGIGIVPAGSDTSLDPDVAEPIGKLIWLWVSAFSTGDGERLAGIWHDPDGRITPAVAGAVASAVAVNEWAIGDVEPGEDGRFHVAMNWNVAFDANALAVGLSAAGVDAAARDGLAAGLGASVGAVWQIRLTVAEVDGKMKVVGLPEGLAAEGGAATPAEAASRVLTAAQSDNADAILAVIDPEDRSVAEQRLSQWFTLAIESFEIGDVTDLGSSAVVAYTWSVTVDGEAMEEAMVNHLMEMLEDAAQEDDENAARVAAMRDMVIAQYREQAALVKRGLESTPHQRMRLRKIGGRWFADWMWFSVPDTAE